MKQVSKGFILLWGMKVISNRGKISKTSGDVHLERVDVLGMNSTLRPSLEK